MSVLCYMVHVEWWREEASEDYWHFVQQECRKGKVCPAESLRPVLEPPWTWACLNKAREYIYICTALHCTVLHCTALYLHPCLALFLEFGEDGINLVVEVGLSASVLGGEFEGLLVAFGAASSQSLGLILFLRFALLKSAKG
jgi:hypothetical protein